MSTEFEKKIEKLFLANHASLKSDDLNQIIKNFLNENQQTQVSNISANDILKFLPKMEFTEDVGVVGSESRRMFDMLINDKLSGIDTISGKIKYLSDFSNMAEKISDTKELLSNVMLLKVLINIFRRSSAGSAGMQFESFIAGVLGGKQVRRDIQSNVVDVYLGNKKYQIKAVSENGKVDMSYTNLQNYFSGKNIPGGKTTKKVPPLNFLVIKKSSGGSKNSERVISLLCYEGVMTYEDFRKIQPSEKFIVPSSFYENFIGEINISKKALNQYSKMLESNVKTVLVEVANLVNNINLLYIKGVTDAAVAGMANADKIKETIKK